MGEDAGRSDAGTSAEAVDWELVRLLRRVRRFAVAVSADVQPRLEPAMYGLLAVVDEAEPIRGGDIVERLGVDKSTISRQVDAVVRLGLAERVPDPSDGRARLVQLTDEGRRRLAEMRQERRRRLQERLADWSEEELHELAGWLTRLGDALSAPHP